MAAMKVEQVDHVEVFVSERYEAARWYERVLGFEITPGFEDWAAGGGPLMLSSGGGTKIALFDGEPQSDREEVGIRRIAFRVSGEDFLAFLDHLAAESVENRVSDHDLACSVYFSDPFGNRLEVTTYEHDHVRSRLKLSGQSAPTSR